MSQPTVIISIDWDGCMINNTAIQLNDNLMNEYFQLQRAVLELYLELEQSLDDKNNELKRSKLKIELEKVIEELAQWCFTNNKALFDNIFHAYCTSDEIKIKFKLLLNSARNNVIAEYCGTFKDSNRGIHSFANGPCWPVFKVLFSKIKKTYEEKYKFIEIDFDSITYQEMIEKFQGQLSTNVFENYLKHFFDGNLKSFADENQEFFYNELRYDNYKIIFFNFLLHYYSEKEKDAIVDILIIDDRSDIAAMLFRWFSFYHNKFSKNHRLHIKTYDGTNNMMEYSVIQGSSDKDILPFELEKNTCCKSTLKQYIEEIKTDAVIYKNVDQLCRHIEIMNKQDTTSTVKSFLKKSLDLVQSMLFFSSYEKNYLNLLKKHNKLKTLVGGVTSTKNKLGEGLELYRNKLEESLYNLVELFPNEIKNFFDISRYKGIIKEKKQFYRFLKDIILSDVDQITVEDCQRIFFEIVDKNVKINNLIAPHDFICQIHKNGLTLAQDKKIQASSTYPRMYVYDIRQACKEGDIDMLNSSQTFSFK